MNTKYGMKNLILPLLRCVQKVLISELENFNFYLACWSLKATVSISDKKKTWNNTFLARNYIKLPSFNKIR